MASVRWRRIRIPTSACVLVIGLAAARTSHGGDHDGRVARAPRKAQSAEVTGTITGTADGAARTWYVLRAKEWKGKGDNSALFMENKRRPGAGRLVVAGYDREDVPFETFERDADGNVISYGAYKGEMLIISFSLEPGQAHYSSAVSPSGSTPSLLLASSYDPTAMLTCVDGQLDVGPLEMATSGQARVEGRFTCRFESGDGRRSLSVTRGRFTVRYVGRI
jgi:hypothetical protein